MNADQPIASVLPLESGDSPPETLREHLKRHEFHHYTAMSHLKKAELIEGVKHD